MAVRLRPVAPFNFCTLVGKLAKPSLSKGEVLRVRIPPRVPRDNYTMHISTHHDKIWSSDCLVQELAILKILRTHAKHNQSIRLVDCVTDEDGPVIITDNQFNIPRDNVIDLAPEFWAIYRTPIEIHSDVTPVKQFNCLMNRVSGERLIMLYKLVERDMLGQGLISFNCLYHDMDPTIEQRQLNFTHAHHSHVAPRWNSLNDRLRNIMPLLLDSNDPDQAAQDSVVTIVVESYVSDDVIAVSEKIFRALQTPRAWTLLCSPNSIRCLRDAGFDVLDDIVDHSYDQVLDMEHRMDLILDQVGTIKHNYHRCCLAVTHNRQRLTELARQWPAKLNQVLQSMGS